MLELTANEIEMVGAADMATVDGFTAGAMMGAAAEPTCEAEATG